MPRSYRSIRILIPIFSPMLFLFGCGQLPSYVTGLKADSFEQQVSVNTKIDLLFIVDNSASMSDKQAALAANFNSFINQFTARNLDFHIAVIATDTTDSPGASHYWANDATWIASCKATYGNPCPLQPYAHFLNNGPGTFQAYRGGSGAAAPAKTGAANNDFVLTNDSINLIAQFQQNMLLGDQGSGGEMGLMAATLALAPTDAFNQNLTSTIPWFGTSGAGVPGITLNPAAGGDAHGLDFAIDPDTINSANQNFLRPDALLSVIEITDEDESEFDYSYVKDGFGRATKVSLQNGLYVPSPTGTVMNNDALRVANFTAALNLAKPSHPELTRFDAVVSPWDGSTKRAATHSDSTYTDYDRFYYFGDACSAPARGNLAAYSASSIGVTVGQAATQNNGTIISICSDFGVSLANLGGNILTALTQFHLMQPPVGNVMVVTVNGAVVPQGATNGCTYDATTQMVSFHGTAVPTAGANISVAYVPAKPI